MHFIGTERIVTSEDRFIPRRAGQNFEYSSYAIQSIEEDDPPFSEQDKKYFNGAWRDFQKFSYIEELRKLLLPSSKKILNFSKSSCQKQTKVLDNIWPVIPRKCPFIRWPSTVLDMPDIQTSIRSNSVDWGANGDIVTIFQEKIYLWNPVKKTTDVRLTSSQIEQCIKFNCAGTRLAVAVRTSTIIFLTAHTKDSAVCIVCCVSKQCTVTSLEWLEEDTLISGCSNGKLMTVDHVEKGKQTRRAHKGAIVAIKKSCRQHYLATCGMDAKLKVWTYPHLRLHYEVQQFAIPKAFDWHPWRESLLVSSSGENNDVLALWNVGSLIQKHHYKFDNQIIDALTFNKLSGELVVSCFNISKHKNSIRVLSSFSETTDIIERHTGRVPYLLWSGDNTQLLTIGDDESLCIWDFLDQKHIKKKTTRNKIYSTDPLQTLFAFRQTIR